ncbi:MAG: hypothetical protein NTV28_05180 [Propionibacteriales bacterium]|nr:hypothetical protein [Propionibacteriales bacterium]
MRRLSNVVPHVGPSPTGRALVEALAPTQWLLDRAATGDLRLTQAGYLKPDVVRELARLLPSMDDWMFGVHREVDVHPVHAFRLWMMRTAGLLRKHKETLLLTRTGKALVDDPVALWQHLADTLVSSKADFDSDATVVTLIHLADDPAHTKMHLVAETMTALGWRFQGGLPITADDVWPVLRTTWALLENVGRGGSRRVRGSVLSGPALCLLRDALVEYSVSEPT